MIVNKLIVYKLISDFDVFQSIILWIIDNISSKWMAIQSLNNVSNYVGKLNPLKALFNIYKVYLQKYLENPGTKPIL